jgi:chorismate mutase
MNTIVEAGTTTTNTVTPHLLEVIRSAEQELARLLQRRAEIARRMGAIKQMLSGMAELFGSSIFDDGLFTAVDRGVASRQKGLTQACRRVLMESRTPLRAQQGCEELQRRFPDLAKRHRHLKASVTTVFHRLAGYSEARCFLDDEGMRVWEWAAERIPNAQNNQLAERTTMPEAEFYAGD